MELEGKKSLGPEAGNVILSSHTVYLRICAVHFHLRTAREKLGSQSCGGVLGQIIIQIINEQIISLSRDLIRDRI